MTLSLSKRRERGAYLLAEQQEEAGELPEALS
jgi:hypothetical protein